MVPVFDSLTQAWNVERRYIMMTAEIELDHETKIGPSVAAAIVRKCRQCRSRVCLSCGGFKNIDGRSFDNVFGFIHMGDSHVKIVVTGQDELPVMCDLMDLVKHGKKSFSKTLIAGSNHGE
jgi:hypothetical protein